MASNITLSYFGPPEQKHVVKVPPMQTLLQTIQAAAGKFKPALVPEQCTLQYNKKPVDLNTPFRLLNVPAGSKLELFISRPQQAAATSSGPAVGASAAPTSQQQQAAGPSPTPLAAAAAQAAPAAAARTQPPAVQPSPAGPPPAAAPAAAQAAPPAAAAAAAAAPSQSSAGAGPSSTAAAGSNNAAGPSASSSSTPSTSSPLAALGVQGPVFVFHQRTLEEAAAAAGPKPMELDPPDDFFELTPDDLMRLQQQANEKKRSEALFKPRAMRDAEQATRAAALGPVRVRLHFPDSTIVQSSFTASQPLSSVQELVTQLALPNVAAALYIYTTPPKTVLKDPTATLYQLKLVPAAHVYVGCEPKRLKGSAAAAAAAAGGGGSGTYPGPFLRPEVLALMRDTVPEQQEGQQQQGRDGVGSAGGGNEVATAADAQRVLAAAAAASRAEGGGSRAAAGAGGAKVPKWLKMGK